MQRDGNLKAERIANCRKPTQFPSNCGLGIGPGTEGSPISDVIYCAWRIFVHTGIIELTASSL